jgi:phosphoribosylformylglycinamidine synthase
MADAAGLCVMLESGVIAELFGEDQARYLLACDPGQAEALKIASETAGVPIAPVGRFGGDEVRFGEYSAPLGLLSSLYRSAFAAALA